MKRKRKLTVRRECRTRLGGLCWRNVEKRHKQMLSGRECVAGITCRRLITAMHRGWFLLCESALNRDCKGDSNLL